MTTGQMCDHAVLDLFLNSWPLAFVMIALFTSAAYVIGKLSDVAKRRGIDYSSGVSGEPLRPYDPHEAVVHLNELNKED